MLKKNKILIFFYNSLGGIIFFLLLFGYGFKNNLAITYMGNTSQRVEDFIFSNFSFDIFIFLSQLLGAYLLICFSINVVIHLFFKIISGTLKINFSKKTIIISNLFLNIFIFSTFLIKNIISYPQIYMENFYNKNSLNKFFLDLVTNHLKPEWLETIHWFLLFLTLVIIITYMIIIKNKIIKISLAIIITGSLSWFLYCYVKKNELPQANRNPSKPNIIILASDALRPDHLSGHGYFRDTSPNIDQLIETGISFQNFFIEIPRTFPSWVSILTGQFSSTHGIKHMFPTSRDLNKNFPSIVKILKNKGYYTAVTADYAGDIFSRIDFGFEKVEVPYFNFNSLIEQTILEAHPFLLPFITNKLGLEIFPVLKGSVYFCPPKLVKDKIIKEISEARDKPFFITSFFSSTHFPYAPPYPYYKTFTDQDYQGPFKYYKQQILSLDKEKKYDLNEQDIEQIRGLYDGGIKAFDEAVGQVKKYLDEHDLTDNTIVIILSDHGENLYEPGLGMGHGEHFRGNYSSKIPFIISLPQKKYQNFKPKSINQLARHVDIAPTLLDLLDLSISDSCEGVSLAPLMKGKKLKKLYAFGETGIWFDNKDQSHFFQKQRIDYPDITYLSEIDFALNNEIVLKDRYRDLITLAKHRYIYDGKYKLVYIPLKNKIIYEMYQTDQENWENLNIIDKNNKKFKALRKKLLKWVSRNQNVILKNDYIFPPLRY